MNESKDFSLSDPFDPADEPILTKIVQEKCDSYRVKFYLEKSLMLTDLFAEYDMTNLWVYIIYKKPEVLQAYFISRQKRQRSKHPVAMTPPSRSGKTSPSASERSWAYGLLSEGKTGHGLRDAVRLVRGSTAVGVPDQCRSLRDHRCLDSHRRTLAPVGVRPPPAVGESTGVAGAPRKRSLTARAVPDLPA